MPKQVGLYRRVMRYYVNKLRKENKALRIRNKELEMLSFALRTRERRIDEIERLLVARSQHYDPQNPRIRKKIIRLREQMLEKQNG